MKKLLSVALFAAAVAACNQKQVNYSDYSVNEAVSKAEWKGSAPDHFHVGSFAIKGSLHASSQGQVNSGDFIIPIASIQDYDLKDPVRQALLEDLKSQNFFNLVLHPEAKFHIKKVEPYSGHDTSAVKGANYLFTGDFSMLGQTHAISFPAKVEVSSGSLTAEAKFEIDRTRWGMKIYNDPSQKLFILPNVNIHLNLKATDAKTAKL